MSARLSGAGGWAVSLALHGLILAAAFALFRPVAPPPPPMRWDVALAPPPSPAVAEARTQPAPAQAERKTVAAASPPPPPGAEPPPREPHPAEAPRQVASAPPPGIAAPPMVAESDPRPRPAPVSAPTPAVPGAAVDKPAPAPAPGRLDGDAERRWQALLAAKLRELKRYPLLSRRLGQEGVVVLEARIRSDGHAAANIKQSSGHAALDRAAVRLFEEAVAALAGQLSPRDDSLLEIPVAYRLES